MTINVFVFTFLFISLVMCCSGYYIVGNYTTKRNMAKEWNYFLAFMCIAFFCFFYVCRECKFGTDTYVYTAVFRRIRDEMNSVKDHSIAYNMERCFVLLCFFISRVFFSEKIFLFIISFFIYLSFTLFIISNCRESNFLNICYAIVCFVFFGTFFSTTNLMRQYIAISIILFSYRQLSLKKYLNFYLLIILASLFHTTALICLFLPLVKLLKINIKTLWLYFFVLIFLGAFATKILEIGINIIFSQYASYLTNSMYGIQSGIKLGPLLNLSVEMILSYMFYKNCDFSDKKTELFFKIFLCSSLFTACSLKFTQIGRISAYFSPALFILIAKAKRNSLFYLTLCILLFYYFIIALFRPEWSGFFPYYFSF